jgi:hypothetical protein
MPDQRNPEQAPPDVAEIERQADLTILSILLHDEPWPWSVDELARELEDRIEAEDSVHRLTRSGLVHQAGNLVFPTRTARRGAEVKLGTA